MAQRKMHLAHPWSMQVEEGAAFTNAERHASTMSFDTFFQEEHERLFKALYFATGDRNDAEELMQDAFLKLWERWDTIHHIEDPTGYLFRVALNGFRMRRRHAAVALRKAVPAADERDVFTDTDMRADVRQLLRQLAPRQRAALVLIDLLGYSSEQAGKIMQIRASTVRALATQGRRVLRTTEGATDA